MSYDTVTKCFDGKGFSLTNILNEQELKELGG